MNQPLSEYMDLHEIFLVFGLEWIGISFVLSLAAGWPALAKQFRARQPLQGERYRFVFSTMGAPRRLFAPCNYLSVTVNASGFSLSTWFIYRLFHPPLFIPWQTVASIETKPSLFSTTTDIRIRGQWSVISLRGKTGERVSKAYADRMNVGSTSS